MAAKRRKKAKKRTAKRRPARRKAAKRKPARRKKAAKRKPARRKKATKRKKAKRKPARRKKAAKRKPARRKKAAKRKPARRKAAKKKKKKSKRKPNAAFMRPVSPDATLAAVVGAKPLPRTELTKKLWAYIRKHGLQDNRNRRMINADAALRRVFGGKAQVSMFEMTKLVSRHVT